MSDKNQCSMDSVVNNLNVDFAAEHADDDDDDFFGNLDNIGEIDGFDLLEDEDIEKLNNEVLRKDYNWVLSRDNF